MISPKEAIEHLCELVEIQQADDCDMSGYLMSVSVIEKALGEEKKKPSKSDVMFMAYSAGYFDGDKGLEFNPSARAHQAGSGETDFRAEIRTERDPSDEYVSFLTLVSEGKSSPYMYIPETLDQDVLDEALRRLNTHPRASMPNLSTIAQKKLDQMGATVHGVLVKNEAGAWAAVSDAGRVMWLDGFEGQACRSGETEQSGG